MTELRTGDIYPDNGYVYGELATYEPPQKEKLVYLCGGMTGLTFEQAEGWRKEVASKLLPHIKPISPLRDYENLRGKKLEKFMPGNIMHSPRAAYKRDNNDVRRSDAILANFLGQNFVSIGSVLELGWGDILQKPMVIVMEEDNIHNHPLLNEASVLICRTLDEGVLMINSFLRSGY